MLLEEKNTGRWYGEVGIALPLDKTFHYAIPPELRLICEVGKRVLVPLGNRKVTGYLLEISSHLSSGVMDKDIKEIIDCLDEAPLFNKGMLDLFRWVATYYLAPLGQVIKTALPPGINWESYYHVSLTSEGKKATTAHHTLSSTSVRILQAIDPCKGNPLNKLLKKYSSRSSFFSLQQKGLICMETKIRRGKTKAKKVAFVEIIRPVSSSESLSPKEQEVISWLDDNKKTSLAELRKRWRNVSTILKKLIQRGMVVVAEEEIYRKPVVETVEREESLLLLTAEQQTAMEHITKALKKHTFHPFLLHGVTGSGKTEIYLRAVQQTLVLNKKALILVPEISLTPQLVGRFQKRLTVEMALLHSGLAPGERYDQWRKVAKGQVHVIIGARSAIFAPCPNLGLIIVDEEHDTSLKQEEGIRYNARDVAVVRAQREGAVVILGSATPSFESVYNAQRGKYQALQLPHRVGGGVLPHVDIVDLKREKRTFLSPLLQEALAQNLKGGGQSLLFLNRRGFSHSAICTECGSAFTCPHCSVALTLHASQNIFLCHYCGYHLPALQICPHCGGGKIQLLGFGTEKVEGEIKKLFPQARVARMDSDVMTKRGAHAKLLQALEKREIQILVGTQMIVKGHDFPGITLVGIIAADVAMNLPDLRAAERCFQLLSQASGRAGRGPCPGRVIIQTFLPENYVIQRAKDHDFWGFYQEETQSRKILHYPPFTRMVNIRVTSRTSHDAEQGIRTLAKKGEVLLKTQRGAVEMLGPSPAPLYQIKGRYRWQLLLKGEKISHLQRLSHSLTQEGRTLKGIKIEVDVDPLYML
jgi:primosomal protein N' (replication factor Y)